MRECRHARAVVCALQENHAIACNAGVGQVGDAVTQMDQATQQNAALVDEMAAAASSLNRQARELENAVAAFKIDGGALAIQRFA